MSQRAAMITSRRGDGRDCGVPSPNRRTRTVAQREFRGRVARLARVFSASRVLERLANGVKLRVEMRRA